jgi:integrase
MRKPNGYGSIKKLSGKRRRPFVFVVSKNGRQVPIKYFTNQIDAEIYQADFNRVHHHRSLPDHKITFAELYHRWLPQHIEYYGSSRSTIDSYHNAYQHCATLHGMAIADIKYYHYQSIIDDMRKRGLSYSSCKKVRSLISLLEKYSLKMEYTTKSYAALLNLGKNKSVRPHHPFTRQKINRLWQHIDIDGADTVLILLYTGMRISELIDLSKSNVNLRYKYIRITKSKTAAGLRIIPIHDRILPLIQHRMSMAGANLIAQDNGYGYNYSQYCTVWEPVMRDIHASGHTTHDCRHTVATLLDNAGANETAKRRILGHVAGDDVTERVYTHKNIRQLRKCIQLLK